MLSAKASTMRLNQNFMGKFRYAIQFRDTASLASAIQDRTYGVSLPRRSTAKRNDIFELHCLLLSKRVLIDCSGSVIMTAIIASLHSVATDVVIMWK